MSLRPKDPYRFAAPIYDLIVSSPNFFQKGTRLGVVSVRAGMSVLDVGCGTGADLACYSVAGCRVHGIDLSPAMLRVARRRLGEHADLRLCSAERSPFADECFDLVLAAYTLHEMPPHLRLPVLAEMSRVVKRGGRILLTDFCAGPYGFPVGWIHSLVRHVYESLAGGEHYHNGRDFLRRGGLKQIVRRCGLQVERQLLHRGNTSATYVLRREHGVSTKEGSR